MPPDSPGFSLNTDDRSITATATGTAEQGQLIGPQVRVRWDGDDVRGQAFGETVSLTASEGRVSGIYAGGPVQLRVSQTDDVLRARGLFAGRLSDLRVSSSGIEGNIGACSYDLDEFDGVYQGWRSCRGLNEPVWLRVPRPVTEMSAAKLAAALGVMLGSV